MLNNVVLIGRLTRDPELKYTSSGIANLRFGLAVNRNFTGANKEKQVDFINCVAWRNQAENMAKFLRKGALIGIEGRIETGSYQAQDGSTRYTTDVVCHSVQFLESKKNGPTQQTNPEAGYQNQQSFNTPYSQPGTNPFDPGFAVPQGYTPGATQNIQINDDDLPF